jgi:hypothetical protein
MLICTSLEVLALVRPLRTNAFIREKKWLTLSIFVLCGNSNNYNRLWKFCVNHQHLPLHLHSTTFDIDQQKKFNSSRCRVGINYYYYHPQRYSILLFHQLDNTICQKFVRQFVFEMSIRLCVEISLVESIEKAFFF